MNNSISNRSPLVHKNGMDQSKNGDGNVRWFMVTTGKVKKFVSGLVAEGFRTNGAPRTPERKRHYNHYGGTTGRRSERGGENNAG